MALQPGDLGASDGPIRRTMDSIPDVRLDAAGWRCGGIEKVKLEKLEPQE